MRNEIIVKQRCQKSLFTAEEFSFDRSCYGQDLYDVWEEVDNDNKIL